MGNQVNPRRLAVSILDRVFRSDSYADILLDSSLRKMNILPKDRALATELVYGTLRWLGWMDWILERRYRGKWLKVPSRVRRALEVGLYQILFLNKVPDYAVVNETVKIVADEKGDVWSRVVNGMLREIIRNRETISPPPLEEDPVVAISVKWSHPEWLVRKWVELFGVDRTISLCRANNKRPDMGVRVNRLKSGREAVQEELRRQNIEASPSGLMEEFLTVEKGGPLSELEVFRRGFFSIQDVSAGLVGNLMNPQPGERILDMAAAPGGKATHMAELGRGQAVVVAVECYSARIRKVVENRDRLGLPNIFPVLADGREFGVKKTFDKVLVDVPCSGLGTIRRRGELRWRRKEEDIPLLVSLQKSLLEAGASFVRPGGVLVYSTCSILPEENAEVVDAFLERHLNFALENARLFVDSTVVSRRGFVETWPDLHGTDGSFAARLKRTQ